MRDYLERFERVGKKVMMRYLLAMIGLMVVLLSFALVVGALNIDIKWILAVYTAILLVGASLPSLILLMALRHLLAVDLIIVLREIASAAQPAKGEGVSAAATAALGEQPAPEKVVAQAPVKTEIATVSRVGRRPPGMATTEKKCPFCGRVLPFGDVHTICPYCGRRLR